MISYSGSSERIDDGRPPRSPFSTDAGSFPRIWLAVLLGRLPISEPIVDDGRVVRTLLRSAVGRFVSTLLRSPAGSWVRTLPRVGAGSAVSTLPRDEDGRAASI